MDRAEALTRWGAFLEKLGQRVDETLGQAEEGCAMLLDVNALDPQPMTIAWMAIENQLRELMEKVDQTWEQKVAAPLEDDSREHAKGVRLRRETEQKKNAVELRIFGDAARKIFEQARVELSKDVKCAQCGAAIALGQAFFRSRHLTCPHCNNVNTFVPGATIAAVEYFCCHHLARQKTIGLYDAWIAAEGSDRSRAEAALREYTTAYLRARIELVPELEKDFEKDLKGKMAFFCGI
jgi:hypothetical protein